LRDSPSSGMGDFVTPEGLHSASMSTIYSLDLNESYPFTPWPSESDSPHAISVINALRYGITYAALRLHRVYVSAPRGLQPLADFMRSLRGRSVPTATRGSVRHMRTLRSCLALRSRKIWRPRSCRLAPRSSSSGDYCSYPSRTAMPVRLE